MQHGNIKKTAVAALVVGAAALSLAGCGGGGGKAHGGGSVVSPQSAGYQYTFNSPSDAPPYQASGTTSIALPKVLAPVAKQKHVLVSSYIIKPRKLPINAQNCAYNVHINWVSPGAKAQAQAPLTAGQIKELKGAYGVPTNANSAVGRLFGRITISGEQPSATPKVVPKLPSDAAVAAASGNLDNAWITPSYDDATILTGCSTSPTDSLDYEGLSFPTAHESYGYGGWATVSVGMMSGGTVLLDNPEVPGYQMDAEGNWSRE